MAQGVTPTNVTLKRGSDWFRAGGYTITLEKTGYKTETQPITQSIEVGWYVFGNIAICSLTGLLIVDPLTGAMWDIDDVNVTLVPEEAALYIPDGRRLRLLSQGPRILRRN